MISRRLLRIKVVKALYAHMKSESDSLQASEKTLVASIDKTYDLYFQMLALVAEVARYAEQRQEAAKQKKLPTFEDLNPNRKFVDNAVVRLIAESDSVNDRLAARKLSWAQYPELIKSLYTQLEQSDYYKKYMTSTESSFREDLALVTDFYTRELEGSELLEEVLDEQSILWNDDLAFAKELFAKTAVNFDTYLQYIEKFTRNWDVERIAFMDNLIMATAVAELVSFQSIPVKVTLDEFIEIAKYYSTPGSGTFINGILDKIVAALTEEGKINKSGRGLI